MLIARRSIQKAVFIKMFDVGAKISIFCIVWHTVTLEFYKPYYSKHNIGNKIFLQLIIIL